MNKTVFALVLTALSFGSLANEQATNPTIDMKQSSIEKLVVSEIVISEDAIEASLEKDIERSLDKMMNELAK